MSNHPDNFKGTPYDMTPEQERAAERLGEIHAVFSDVLNTLKASCIESRVQISKAEIEVVMEAVGEALVESAEWVLEYFPGESYTPADCQKMIDNAHAEIVEALRIKPIDWSRELNDMLRPVIVNPATPGFMDGEDRSGA